MGPARQGHGGGLWNWLLGGPTRDYIRLYTHVGIHDPDEMVADSQRDIADGFTAMKTGSWRDDILLPEIDQPAYLH